MPTAIYRQMPIELMKRSSLKRSHHHLKQLVESIVAEEFDLRRRGLSFLVDEIEVFGSPPERLKVWATLHFLPLGSPFCCRDAGCHVALYGALLERVNDALRRNMHLRQAVSAEFVVGCNTAHCGVEFDDLSSGRCPSMDTSNVDKRDALGRTALMRAAVRGHCELAEELLAAGADPTVVDNRGRGILEQLRTRQQWFIRIVEIARAQRLGRQ
jgi:hypothetical protein